MFALNMATNIVIICTFCDVAEPVILPVLRADNFPFYDLYKFNNSATFLKYDKNNVDPIIKGFWSAKNESFKIFIDALKKTKDVSLDPSKIVMNERQRLGELIKIVSKIVESLKNNMQNIRDEMAFLDTMEIQINASSQFD